MSHSQTTIPKALREGEPKHHIESYPDYPWVCVLVWLVAVVLSLVVDLENLQVVQ